MPAGASAGCLGHELMTKVSITQRAVQLAGEGVSTTNSCGWHQVDQELARQVESRGSAFSTTVTGVELPQQAHDRGHRASHSSIAGPSAVSSSSPYFAARRGLGEEIGEEAVMGEGDRRCPRRGGESLLTTRGDGPYRGGVGGIRLRVPRQSSMPFQHQRRTISTRVWARITVESAPEPISGSTRTMPFSYGDVQGSADHTDQRHLPPAHDLLAGS